MESPAPLPYESPPSTAEFSTSPDGPGLRIDVRPISNWGFVAVILPTAITLGFVSALLAGLTAATGSLSCYTVVLLVFFIACALSLHRRWKHRNNVRTVWVQHDEFGFCDLRTNGKPVYSGVYKYQPAVVKKSLSRPWTYLLIVRPVFDQGTFNRIDTVILLTDTDRPLLERIAAAINAFQPGPNAEHFRGAFEVITGRASE